MHNKKKVVVGLSGGVDSSVTALLLKNQGYDVEAIYMQNWEVENDNPYCSAEQDLIDASRVSEYLQIPFHVVNFSREYWQRVFDHCLDEFNQGRTPNPDIFCNQEIKFKCFLNYVLSKGADFLATGHYARIQLQKNFNQKNNTDNDYQLCKGIDNTKDQSYFLYTLGQSQLKHCLFPLGDYHKTEVRTIAQASKLLTYNKKDSTGICFIGERKFKDFLKEFLLSKPGLIKSDTGQTIGAHDGLMFYTIGQRKGLNIGGIKEAEESAWYVVAKDIKNNVLIVAQGNEHPLLFKSTLICQQLTWVSDTPPLFPLTCTAKIRYRQSDQTCEVKSLSNENHLFEVTFPEKQRAITPGQAIVFYQNEVCLGGGIIVE